MKVYDIISESPINEIGNPINALRSLRTAKNVATSAKGVKKAAEVSSKTKDLTSLTARAASNPATKQAAELAIKSVNPKVLAVLKGLGIVYEVVDYYREIHQIELDYDEFVKYTEAGKPVPIANHFSGLTTTQEAYAEATHIRELSLGQHITTIVVMSGFAGRFLNVFGIIVGLLPGNIGAVGGAGISLLGSLVKMMERGTYGKMISVALGGFLMTDMGKKFMFSAVGQIISLAVGKPAAFVLDNLTAGVDALGKYIAEKYPELGKALGLDKGVVPDAMKTQIKEPGQSVKDKEQAVDTNVPAELQSKKVGNKLYVGGVQITGDDGKIIPGSEPRIKRINSDAEAWGIPSPVAGLK